MRYLYVELVGGSRIHIPEVDEAVANAVVELHETDDTVFGDPDASVALPLADGLEVTLMARDVASVVSGESVAF